MSDNEASGSYEKPDTNYQNDSTHDDSTPATGQGRFAKWFGVVVAAVTCLGAVAAIFGDGLPKCDSTTSRGMIEDLYPQVPLNAAQATVAELTGITETGYDTEAKVRTCQATLLDSMGVQHSVAWSTTDAGDTYDYELEVRS